MPGPRRVAPSARRREGLGPIRVAVRHESRHEALPLRDPLDLDRHRLDRAFDALESLVVCGWREVLDGPGRDEALHESAAEGESDTDGENRDDSRLDQVDEIGVGHVASGKRLECGSESPRVIATRRAIRLALRRCEHPGRALQSGGVQGGIVRGNASPSGSGAFDTAGVASGCLNATDCGRGRRDPRGNA